MKKIFTAALFSGLLFTSFNNAFGQEDDIDSMFDDAQDVEAVQTEAEKPSEKVNDGTFPLKLSGHLDSEIGAAYIYCHDDTNKPSGYFSFNNYLYLDARPTKESLIHGVVGIAFPGYDFGINECYFDYIIKNRLYITAGKKSTTWGYTRLFSTASNATQTQQDESIVKALGAENTNILYDSGKGTTVMCRIPAGTGTLTGLCLYKGTLNKPGMSDLIFAASAELIVEKTSVNVFGRGGQSETDSNDNVVGPLIGLEVKRTILGADVYGQGLCRFDSNKKFLKVFECNNFYESSFKTLVFTGGFYKWWDEIDYPIGFNVEYQGVRSITNTADESYSGSNTNSFAFEGGIRRLGKRHNVKLGAEWTHCIETKTGFIKPGIIVSGIFPNVDWKNGVKWEYGQNLPATGKWTIGTYFTLALNY
ncbi:hypothetical protein [Treponema sp. C6A8]|uniref:hypothetical protein n=1 Tax=Treponema sp. C6A8 TaxID=1410609 RepID=UPI0004831838|nr:hypothetical protein [Treponema sp. C6A8]